MPAESPIGEPSEETLKLEAFLSVKPHGAVIPYQEFIDELGIDVRDLKYRGKFYSACRRLNREVRNIYKYGYRLSSCANALPIVEDKIDRVVSGAGRVVRAVENLEDMHEDLSLLQREVLSNSKNVSNAIRGKARSAKKIVRKEVARITEAAPHI